MPLTINEATERAELGTLTQGDLIAMFCGISKTSAEVREVLARLDARDALRIELTPEQMAEAYKAGNESIYDDQARGYTLD